MTPRPPRRCVHCPNLIQPGEHCPDHPRRQWNSNPRINRKDTARHRRLKANYVGTEKKCCLQFEGCTGTAQELDRIDNRGDYAPGNLQGVCHACHLKKTSAEGNAAQGHSVKGVSLAKGVSQPAGAPSVNPVRRNASTPHRLEPEQHTPRARRIEICGTPIDSEDRRQSW